MITAPGTYFFCIYSRRDAPVIPESDFFVPRIGMARGEPLYAAVSSRSTARSSGVSSYMSISSEMTLRSLFTSSSSNREWKNISQRMSVS